MTDNLKVFCSIEDQRYFVGRLRQYEKRIFFEYDADFLSTGVELSPFKLPLRPGVFEDKDYTFNGLYGLFNDSLPDGWGLLLLDRILQKQGLKLEEISPFNRLALVADQGMGGPYLQYPNLRHAPFNRPRPSTLPAGQESSKVVWGKFF